MIVVYVSDIRWDTDGKAIEGLPTEGYVVLEPDVDETEAEVIEQVEEHGLVADMLSDRWGWCIEGLVVEVVANLLEDKWSS